MTKLPAFDAPRFYLIFTDRSSVNFLNTLRLKILEIMCRYTWTKCWEREKQVIGELNELHGAQISVGKSPGTENGKPNERSLHNQITIWRY